MPISPPLAPIFSLRIREHLCTSYVWADMQISIVSAQHPDYIQPPELLLFQFHSSKLHREEELRDFISLARKNIGVQVSDFRHKLGSELGFHLTRHLLEVQKVYIKRQVSVTEETANRYRDLVAWGEPNSAKVLSQYWKIPIRTVHSRLRLAREAELLDAPGAGYRF